MEKNRIVTIGVVVISIIVIIVIAISLINTWAPWAGNAPTAVNTNTPLPSSTPDPCAPENVKAQVMDFNHIAREFDDLSVIAQNTPREQLTPIITQLQGIRRRSEDYLVPSCMQKLKEYQLNYMNVFINTLVALYSSLTSELTEDRVATINQGMAAAVQYHDQYLIEMARLLGVTLPAPSAPAAPIGTP
jgi:hypothetical protein